MKTIDKIPSTKIGRAASVLKTGLKVGTNYVAYYGEKIIDKDLTREKLDKKNAKDIYNGLSEMKGSALKVAQMLSMEKNIIPQAYAQEFSQAQYSVPPLSPPLVKKTFKKHLGKQPTEIFDFFDLESIRAASMGQVHKATLNDQELAVKIQYPGVAESISSDLALVKPFAIKMFNLKGEGSEKFFQEVESKLLEETDYKLELRRSIEISTACKKLPHLVFPKYFKKLSSEKILTMTWIHGKQISEFYEINKDQGLANTLGQSLWDLYMFQMHELKMVQADPHPGNFLITEKNQLGVIDFGCIKELPQDFYDPYFALTEKKVLDNPQLFESNLYDLEVIKKTDKGAELKFFKNMFHEMLSLFATPFEHDTFDFSSKDFLNKLGELGTKYGNDSELRKYNGNRGSKHLLYVNRTFFGLYNLLHELKCTISINNYKKYLSTPK